MLEKDRGGVSLYLAVVERKGTHMRGRIRDQELFSIRHSEGTRPVAKMMTVMTHRAEITSESQKRLRYLSSHLNGMDHPLAEYL